MRAKSGFAYILLNTTPMVELMRHRLRKQPTRSIEHFMVHWEAPICQASVEIGGLDVFRQHHLWTEAACSNCRVFMVHCYRYIVYSTTGLPESYADCLCRHSLLTTPANYAIRCPALTNHPLHFLLQWDGLRVNAAVGR